MQIFRRRAEDARAHKKQLLFAQKLREKKADITAELAREERLLAREAAALQVQPGRWSLGSAQPSELVSFSGPSLEATVLPACL